MGQKTRATKEQLLRWNLSKSIFNNYFYKSSSTKCKCGSQTNKSQYFPYYFMQKMYLG